MDMLYGVAFRFTGNRSDAQNLTQDALTAVMRNGSGRGKSPWAKSQLLTALRHTFVNDYQQKP